MITAIIILIVYTVSVYHSLKFTKYLYELFEVELTLFDLIPCVIPIVNTFSMIWYLLIVKSKR